LAPQPGALRGAGPGFRDREDLGGYKGMQGDPPPRFRHSRLRAVPFEEGKLIIINKLYFNMGTPKLLPKKGDSGKLYLKKKFSLKIKKT